MKSKIKDLVRKPFVRNVIILATGTAAAQVITMLLSPIITRVYGPEAYGMMGVFMAILSIVTPIAALTYPIAIVLPKGDRDAHGLIRLSIYISTGMAAIIALILLFFKHEIVRLFNIEDVAPYLYLIPIVVLSSGFLQVIEQWVIRTKQFRVSANVSILQALITQGGIVSIGMFYPVPSVLIVLSAMREGLKSILMLLFTRKSNYKHLIGGYETQVSIKGLAKKHKDFPLYRAPEVFINAVSQGLPILLLTSFFGPASAGFYSIGKSVLNVPSQLIGNSVGDVFYPRISEAAHNGENITNLIKKATLYLGAVGVIPFGIVFIFGPELFSFVFGVEWGTAGEYARWIALWSFFGFMNRPSVRALPVLSAQAFQLKFTIFMLIIRIGVLAIGYYLFASDVIAIAFFGVSGAILNFALILITIHKSKKFDNV